MKSYRGIYYDLNESIYSFEYDNLKFYFSSKLYLEKFKKQYINYIKNETIKLQSKYKCILYADEMLLIDLYKQIEKRGFLVFYKSDSISENYFINAIIDVEESRK